MRVGGLELKLEHRGVLAMTPALRQAIGFLALSNTDLSARLADLQAANASLVLTSGPDPELWLGLMRQISPPSDSGASVPWTMPLGRGGQETDHIAQGDPGLISHVSLQLPLLIRRNAERPVAEAFLQALEPSGWLGASLDEIAAWAGVSVSQAESVLRQLQAAEPIGLFARSLEECLRLQAEEQALLTPAFDLMLANLPLLAAGDMDALAEICGCDVASVLSMAQTLRRMNPKPGAAFSQSAAPERPPDLVLIRDGDGWIVELNAQTTPTLKLTPTNTTPDALRAARALVQALERRHATVLTIAAQVVTRQDSYLRGASPLAALTINDLALATGMHRSTVSRVTAALFIRTPARTLCLRELLCAAAPVARRQEEPLSVQAVLERMRWIVSEEDPARPLSDADIAKRLLPEGAALARRTVAKYRALAGIPPRATRRGGA